ncbi:RING-H2 finger protein ATL70 [Platanthera zijinensis]|uniref:RING-H2 finger protein ATL70 n=1 Tax=Platanthera zijinensis TaxID=2320716 RepID=A0AAP0BWM7_9ASPA
MNGTRAKAGGSLERRIPSGSPFCEQLKYQTRSENGFGQHALKPSFRRLPQLAGDDGELMTNNGGRYAAFTQRRHAILIERVRRNIPNSYQLSAIGSWLRFMMSINHKEPTLTTEAAGGVDLDASADSAATHQYIETLGYVVIISVCALFLITTIIVAYCLSNRAARAARAAVDTANPPHPRRRRRGEPSDDGRIDIETGPNNVLKGCPKVTYAEAKRRDPRVTGSGCSVCLADYGDDDEVLLRLLPECGHLFHERCVDTWLRLRPTCPVCRSSPAPPRHMANISRPLAEVVTPALWHI